jgi:hypothetical protein
MEIIISHIDDVITEHASTTLHLTDLVRLLARQAAREVMSDGDVDSLMELPHSETDHE